MMTSEEKRSVKLVSGVGYNPLFLMIYCSIHLISLDRQGFKVANLLKKMSTGQTTSKKSVACQDVTKIN